MLAEHGLRQLHAAETEKYAHVTYFFNGGREEEWPGETRMLVPSPREVGTYDQQPEMSAAEVADRVLRRARARGYSFAVVNFANPDMVGHTGVIPAVVEAVETDGRLPRPRGRDGRAAAAASALITADHGNAEQMLEPDGISPHTAHTSNLVPLIVTDPDARLRDDGELQRSGPDRSRLPGAKETFTDDGRKSLQLAHFGCLTRPLPRLYSAHLVTGPARSRRPAEGATG